MKYIKQPIPVEAFRWGSDDVVPGWFAQAVKDGAIVCDGDNVFIHTLEGVMRAEPGSYIIRGVEHELYPCRASVFEKTYVPFDPGDC